MELPRIEVLGFLAQKIIFQIIFLLKTPKKNPKYLDKSKKKTQINPK